MANFANVTWDYGEVINLTKITQQTDNSLFTRENGGIISHFLSGDLNVLKDTCSEEFFSNGLTIFFGDPNDGIIIGVYYLVGGGAPKFFKKVGYGPLYLNNDKYYLTFRFGTSANHTDIKVRFVATASVRWLTIYGELHYSSNSLFGARGVRIYGHTIQNTFEFLT